MIYLLLMKRLLSKRFINNKLGSYTWTWYSFHVLKLKFAFKIAAGHRLFDN